MQQAGTQPTRAARRRREPSDTSRHPCVHTTTDEAALRIAGRGHSGLVPPAPTRPTSPARPENCRSFDVFTSFRSISNKQGDHSLFARDFYNAFLSYWPPEHQLIILHENDQRTARPVQRLVQCLQRATCVSQPVVNPSTFQHLYEHKVADQSREVNANFTSIDDVQMQAWKYVLDWHSEAELLGVLDDDACSLGSCHTR